MRKNVDQYFEGYEKIVTENAKGKKKIDYVYTGDYYRIDTDEAGRRGIKLRILALYLCYLVLFFVAGYMPALGNTTGVVGVVSLIGMIPSVFWLLGVIGFATAKEYMVIRKYRYGLERIKKSLSVVFFFAAAQLVAEAFVLILFHGQLTNIPRECVFIALLIAECILVYVNRRYADAIEVDLIAHDLVPESSRESH